MDTVSKGYRYLQVVYGYMWWRDLLISDHIISDPFGFLKRVTKMFVEKHIIIPLYIVHLGEKTSYVYGHVILWMFADTKLTSVTSPCSFHGGLSLQGSGWILLTPFTLINIAMENLPFIDDLEEFFPLKPPFIGDFQLPSCLITKGYNL